MNLIHPRRRVAVISGASSGIGASTAQALAAQGFPVALGARRAERCEELAAKLRADGYEALGAALDVTDDQSVAAFARRVVVELGQPEVVVSNAGSVTIGDARESSTASITRDLDVHVLGAHRLIRAFVPGMVERQRGDVVFISSDMVTTVRPGVAGYVAGKGALEGLAVALRAELEGTGVRVGIVRPGATLTELGSDLDPERFRSLYKSWRQWGNPRHGSFLQPDHIAQAVVSVATAPRGMHLTLLEIQPEAPIRGTD